AHRHDLQAVALDRVGRGDIDLEAEHHRDAGAVDVGVHQAHAPALHVQGQGEVGGHGRFADAALAAGDGDEVFDVGQLDLGRTGGGVHRVVSSSRLRLNRG